jgi:hypothetical protein
MSSSQYTRDVETLLLSSRQIGRRKSKISAEKSKNATWGDDEPTTTLRAQQVANRLQQILFPSEDHHLGSSLIAVYVGSSLSYTTSSTQTSRKKMKLSLGQFEVESQKLVQLLYTTEFVGKVDQRYHSQYLTTHDVPS